MTIDDILNRADKATDLQELIELWNEVAINKKKYSLAEILLANKRISILALRANGDECEKGNFYWSLFFIYLRAIQL